MGGHSSKSSPGSSRPSVEHGEYLERALDSDLSRLYWPNAPYEGPVRLRFGCASCHSEAVLLSPYPALWRDLLDLQGECFACGDMRRMEAVFIESGAPIPPSQAPSNPTLTVEGRAVIWRFVPHSTSTRELCAHLFLFLSSSPPSSNDLDVVLLLLKFDRTIRPHNFKFANPNYTYPVPIPPSKPIAIATTHTASPSSSAPIAIPSALFPPNTHNPLPPNPNHSNHSISLPNNNSNNLINNNLNNNNNTSSSYNTINTNSNYYDNNNSNTDFSSHSLSLQLSSSPPSYSSSAPPSYRSIHLDSGCCLLVEPPTSSLLHELALLSSTHSPWSLSSLFSPSLKPFPPNFSYSVEFLSLPLAEKVKIFLGEFNGRVRVHEVVRWRVLREEREVIRLLGLASVRHVRGFWKVEYVGEVGVDLGGMTREMVTGVVGGLVDPKVGLMERVGIMGSLYPKRVSKNKNLNVMSLNNNNNFTSNNNSNNSNLSHSKEKENEVDPLCSPSRSRSGSFSSRIGEYRVLGRALGRALVDGVQVPCAMSRALFKLLQGKSLGFDDLGLVDREAYIQILRVLHYEPSLIDSLALVFAADDGTELVPGGRERAVTGDNVFEWARLYAQWKLIDSVEEELEAILEGFYDIVPVQLLSIFSELELEQVLCGSSNVDVEDMERNCVVMNGESAEAREQVNAFWNIMKKWSPSRRLQLVQFVTGAGRAPLSFAHLHPPFTISFERAMAERSLPRAHTCFHRLDVPMYQSEAEMQRALEIALDYGLIGFGRR